MKSIEKKETALEFAIHVEGSTLEVKAKPYMANEKRRFRVSVNGSPVHIFGWDHTENKLKAIESATAAETIPKHIENAIGCELQNRIAA